MTTLTYTVQFLTPAFLGDAEQNGRWRTPPFKALLRQWWRVVYAADHNFNVNIEEMRREEGLLFGNAWLSHRVNDREVADHCKSLVRLRLENVDGSPSEGWARGTQKGVAPLPTGLQTSYAWFGLVKRGGGLPDRTAIKPSIPEGKRRLHLVLPESHGGWIELTVRLIHTFGQVGTRSRGGWGSLEFQGLTSLEGEDLSRFARSLQECLNSDWAMSLAQDQKGLCMWESTTGYETWEKAMQKIAEERKRVRTELRSCKGKDLRIALGFAGDGRMPSPLRWKIFSRGNGKLGLRVFAMPHRLPADSGRTMSPDDLQTAWNTVLSAVDQSSVVKRINAGVHR
ncbi:MAG TPA: RAMP superfamily CRISPR-associated protein [Nitrospiraceae bacterium]|jgi:CRISPR-associated protein Cmr1|nr:RAMP superfamily CRISPR-associated protein [Nitrospiraceae bacterium]